MPKKIRVYELAHELGLTNKEALDLCLSLGMGVKSHSSSIEDAQADRARRKADREGLRRPVQPEEPAAPAKATKKAAAAKKVAATEQPRHHPHESDGDIPPIWTPATSGTDGELPDGGGSTHRRSSDRAPAWSPAADLRPSSRDRRALVVRSSPSPAAAPPPRRRPAPPPPHRLPRVPHRHLPPLRRPRHRLRPLPPRPLPPRPLSPRPQRRRQPLSPRLRPRRYQHRRLPPPLRSAHPQQCPRCTGTSSGTNASPGGKCPRRSCGGCSDRPRPADVGSGPAAHQPIGQARSAPARRSAPFGQRPPDPAAARAPVVGGLLLGPVAPVPVDPAVARAAAAMPVVPAAPAQVVPVVPVVAPVVGSGHAPVAVVASPAAARRRPVVDLVVRPRRPPGRGGPGMGRGRPNQRRPRRRRRNLEELEPTQLTAYTPSTAPVPDSEVIVERGSTARDLGPKLNRSAGDVIRFLLLQGEMVTATQSLTDDMIELFAAELGATVRLVDPGEEREAELLAKYFDDDDDEEDEADLRPRPPVVTVMGHVDHGKTLLLDRIRSANVVAGEAGGITQHIGAYQVEYNGKPITFIDTPGHEAFSAMRARGAEVTDIVVLVVAADDGVMPQTIEAINHAKLAEVPIIVAVNKIDREEADPNRVLQQISEYGLVPEAWGGDTITVEVSALQNLGVDDLLEQIVLVAEVEELVASPEGPARGFVIEAELEVGRGPVASVIVERGTLRVGDPIVAGAAWGKVKALVDDRGDQIKEAPPSTPVQVLGFSEPPNAGDELRVAPELAQARTIGEARAHRYRVAGHVPAAASALGGAKLEDLFEQIQRGETATLNIILKADVQGSLEAITESLRKLERDDVKLSFVQRGVGGITENDVQTAQASNATIIGFNVRPDRRAREQAVKANVEIRTYEIIYNLLEDLQAAMLGLLAPVYEEIVTGEAEVREVFRVPRIGAIAGCYVREGVITRGSKVRFLREGVVIWKGSITSLRRFKDDAREVSAGFECGIGLSDYQDLKNGDVIETYEEREIPRT